MGPAVPGLRCRNGHQVPSHDFEPDHCPTCGVPLSSKHPMIVGLLFGAVACVAVSGLELALIPYVNYAAPAVGLGILVSAVPLVFALSYGLGAAYFKARFNNKAGLGSVVLGTVPVFVLFLLLWLGLLFALALASCGPEC